MFLRKTKALEKEIETFIFRIQKVGLIFAEAMGEYFKGNRDAFCERVSQMKALESEIDKIRKSIEYNLYSDMLIPESRGDVLGLLETLDDVANVAQDILVNFDIERPIIPTELQGDFLKMVDMSKKCIEELVNAVTTFFTHTEVSRNYSKKVLFYEHEVDMLEENLKRQVFQGGKITSLSQKTHMRYFIEAISSLSDCAEDVCERLTISTIKRTI